MVSSSARWLRFLRIGNAELPCQLVIIAHIAKLIRQDMPNRDQAAFFIRDGVVAHRLPGPLPSHDRAASISPAVSSWPASISTTSTDAPAFFNVWTNRCVSAEGITRSNRPVVISIDLHAKSGPGVIFRGIIGRKRMALEKTSGLSSMIAAAILAPLEYPRAMRWLSMGP